ncbi:MAG TPA: hypothetical protein VIB02_04590 [Candidatus Limnocylindrales bacterium]|jgi:hypothetical protein
MNAPRDTDQIIHAWLEEGPTVLPAPTVRAIEVATRATPQRRRLVRLPWRTRSMANVKLLAGAAASLVLLIGAVLFLGPRDGQRSVGAPIATPSSSPSATGEPSPSASPALETFTSPKYGYSIKHPESWRSTPATRSWTAGQVVPDATHTDTFHPEGTTLGAVVAIAARPIPDGAGDLDWMDDWTRYREGLGGPCFGPASAWTAASVAGVPARRIEAPCDFAQAGQSDFAEYVWVVDGIGYVITGTPSVVDGMVATFQAP